MFDRAEFDREINAFIMAGQCKQAEEMLLTAQSVASESGDVRALEYLAYRFAHYYSMPETQNLELAEKWFLERERLTPGVYSSFQTATFYFYVMGDNEKVVRKIDEIDSEQPDRSSYYSALTLKGQALLALQKLDDVGRAIDELVMMARTNPQGLPYGDEINLMDAAVSVETLRPKCCELLGLVVPKMRDQEYRERGDELLKSCGIC
jgi:hypothetical protein